VQLTLGNYFHNNRGASRWGIDDSAKSWVSGRCCGRRVHRWQRSREVAWEVGRQLRGGLCVGRLPRWRGGRATRATARAHGVKSAAPDHLGVEIASRTSTARKNELIGGAHARTPAVGLRH